MNGREGALSVGAALGQPVRAFSRRFETQRPTQSVWRLRAPRRRVVSRRGAWELTESSSQGGTKVAD